MPSLILIVNTGVQDSKTLNGLSGAAAPGHVRPGKDGKFKTRCWIYGDFPKRKSPAQLASTSAREGERESVCVCVCKGGVTAESRPGVAGEQDSSSSHRGGHCQHHLRTADGETRSSRAPVGPSPSLRPTLLLLLPPPIPGSSTAGSPLPVIKTC